MANENKKFPGIELHLHLDGALEPEMMLHLAKIAGVRLPADTPEALRPYVTVDESCTSLEDYLQRFSVTTSVMQKKESIAESVRLLLARLHAQGHLYAEIRFAPQLHLQQGLTQREVVAAAVSGLESGLAECEGLQAQLILCCMRFDANRGENLETIRMAKEFLGRGVCAADLAGSEIGHPAEDYAEMFELAAQLGVPYTIHGGESDGASSVRGALSIGAQRVGHGVHAVEDMALVEALGRDRVPLEMCPTSNVHTKAVASLRDYPVRLYLEKGIRVTINTDNPAISQTTLRNEFETLEREMGLTKEEKEQLLINAADAAFLCEKEREALKARLRAALS